MAVTAHVLRLAKIERHRRGRADTGRMAAPQQEHKAGAANFAYQRAVGSARDPWAAFRDSLQAVEAEEVVVDLQRCRAIEAGGAGIAVEG